MMILSDNETKVDLLNYESIATTVVKLLRERPDHPITIGVHGDWGAGKSSILEMIEAGLSHESKVLCLKFNGWRFQGFEDAKIALIEGIVTGLLEKRPALKKTTDAVKDVLKRIDWLKVAKKAGGLALTAYAGIPSLDQIQTVVHGAEALLSDPAKALSKENVQAAVENVKGLLKPKGESKNVPEEIGEFRKAFDRLLDAAEVEQLVVLIDDLDRCLPDTAIETLEAVRLFVFTSRTAFVVAADETMIEYAVRRHFPDLPNATGQQTYARKYLEKLIQVPFRIPALGDAETRIYVTLLLIGAQFGEDDPAFASLLEVARERLKRPWATGSLDAAAIKKALGDKHDRAQHSIVLSEQIGPTLASGAKGNPRQIKRFLNTLFLRQGTAQARGFGGEIKLPILAKLMLAEQFMTPFFDQIATAAATAANGVCADLEGLETSKSENEGGVAKGKRGEVAEVKSAGGAKIAPIKQSVQLGEWLGSPAIRAWAEVSPPLANVDLRPYLFVTKDRKDYFGPASVLGHLVSVVEQLLGPKFGVQGMEADLRKLAAPEAIQIFGAVRGRILGGDVFDSEPAGVAGLTVLVKAHPALQGNLLDLLEALPKDRVGPWVCSGWDGVLKEGDAVARFERLLEAWEAEGGSMLKAAAAATLRTRRRGR